MTMAHRFTQPATSAVPLRWLALAEKLGPSLTNALSIFCRRRSPAAVVIGVLSFGGFLDQRTQD